MDYFSVSAITFWSARGKFLLLEKTKLLLPWTCHGQLAGFNMDSLK